MRRITERLNRSNGLPLRLPFGLTTAVLMLSLTIGCTSLQSPVVSKFKPVSKKAVPVEARPDPFLPAPDAPSSTESVPAAVSDKPDQKQLTAGIADPGKPTAISAAPLPEAKPDHAAPDAPTPFEIALSTDTITSLDFQEEKLSNVLKVFSAVMGINVVAQKDIAGEEITIYLKNVTPMSALVALCKQYGFWYEEGNGFIRLGNVEDFGRVVVGRDGTIRRLMFRGMALSNALGVISEHTGRNVVCKKNISDKKVFLLLSDVSVRTAIEIICKELGLWYKKDEPNDYFVLMSAEDYGKNLLIDYRPKTRVYNLKHVSAPQLAEVIALAMGNRVEYTPPNMVRSYEHLKTPDYEDDEADIEAASTDVDFSENIEAPEFEEKQLTPEKIEQLVNTRLELMLTAQDVRQINQQIGFALIAIFLRNNAILASSTDSALLDEIGEIIAELDTPTPQVLIEAKILRINLSDDFTSFFDLNIAETGGEGTFSWSSEFPPSAAYGTALYNFIDLDNEWSLDATLKLLKDEGIIKSITTPMIVAAQNSEAKAFLGTVNYPLVTSIDAESQVNDEGSVISVILNPVIEKHDIGVTLKITPQINKDRSVTLRLYIEESDIASQQAVIPYYDGKAEALRDYRVDVVEKEEINTTINIPAGHTLALGGLVDEQDITNENKVPVLGDIPLFGFFFRKIETRKSRTERIFLLKPHIMMSAEESGAVSREALQNTEHPFVKERRPKLFDFDEETQKLIRKGEAIHESDGTSDRGL